MDQFFYLCLIGVLAASVAAGLIFAGLKLKPKRKVKKAPQFFIGAIRVTDRQGRDMLIIPKDDGSFEMQEEQKIRKCV